MIVWRHEDEALITDVATPLGTSALTDTWIDDDADLPKLRILNRLQAGLGALRAISRTDSPSAFCGADWRAAEVAQAALRRPVSVAAAPPRDQARPSLFWACGSPSS